MLELISVHVPKCAGSSFSIALQQAYGPDHVALDYGDRLADPAAPVNVDPDGFYERVRARGYPELRGKRVVHGHFHLDKYRDIVARRRIVILRHPVDRTVSNYRYWQQLDRRGHTLQNYMLDQALTVTAFARLPIMRHLYERVYFAGVERSAFDYVGSLERLDRDVAALAELLGRPLTMARVNVGPAGSSGDAEPAEIEPHVRAELETILAGDIAFYRRWCER